MKFDRALGSQLRLRVLLPRPVKVAQSVGVRGGVGSGDSRSTAYHCVVPPVRYIPHNLMQKRRMGNRKMSYG